MDSVHAEMANVAPQPDERCARSKEAAGGRVYSQR